MDKIVNDIFVKLSNKTNKKFAQVNNIKYLINGLEDEVKELHSHIGNKMDRIMDRNGKGYSDGELVDLESSLERCSDLLDALRKFRYQMNEWI